MTGKICEGEVMRKKSLAIMLSLFALIILVVILSSTIFSLSKVELSFAEIPTTYSSKDSENILKSGKFKHGQSIFLVSKKQHIKNIEENYPRLRVLNIETRFPNKLVVTAIERQDFLALYNSGVEKYYIVDGQMKVLRVVEDVASIGTVSKCLVTQNLSSYTFGDFIKYDNEIRVLSTLQEAFWRCGYSEKQANQWVKSVYVDTTKDELTINSYCKFRITIKSPSEKLAEKMFAGSSTVFNNDGVGEDFVGNILVYENKSEQKIYANAILNG